MNAKLFGSFATVVATVAIPASLTLNVSSAFAANFTLIGSELGVGLELQSTPTSQLFTNSFPVSAIVSESAVEFPNAASLFGNIAPGFFTVNGSIDVGADYLKLDYANAGFGTFANTFKNTVVFTFTAPIALQITNVLIDPSTTLGLTPDHVTFEGNQLFVNVSGLPYNPNSVARINLSGTTTPDPNPAVVPEPATMLGIALAGGLAYCKRRKTSS
jgi:hypothetical protein